MDLAPVLTEIRLNNDDNKMLLIFSNEKNVQFTRKCSAYAKEKILYITVVPYGPYLGFRFSPCT